MEWAKEANYIKACSSLFSCGNYWITAVSRPIKESWHLDITYPTYMFLVCWYSGCLVGSQWCLCSRSWSCYAISKASSAPMLTTATHTATCTTAAPVHDWSGPSSCCTETLWTPSGRAATPATWLSGAKNRRRWVKNQMTSWQFFF